MENKTNIYINSKNRNPAETVSKFVVKVPENLLRLHKDEYFSLNVNGFYCFNTWFNCLNNFNNEFQLIIRDNNGNVTSTTDYKLLDGNPDLIDVKNNLNLLLSTKVTITYDKLKNKFMYKRILPITNSNHKIYLKIINAEDFLGFRKSDRDVEIELPLSTNVYSTYIVNVLGDEAITIKINGDVSFESNTIDNFGNTHYQPSDIIFMKPIDVPTNGLLQYNNQDSGDSFQYKLSNVEQVTWFELSVHNQDDEIIPDFGEYILLLQFIKHRHDNKIESLLLGITDYIKQIYLLISSLIFPSYR